MRLQNIFSLQKLYYLFFVRKVLSVGILKEKLFRVIAILVALGLTVGTTIFLYNIFDDSLVSEDIDFMMLIIRMQGLNIVVWTAVAFLLLKMLFLKKGSFLKMTSQLPITNRERNVSLLLFELIMAMTTIVVVSFSHSLAVLLRSHFSYATLLICAIIFSSLICYLSLQLLYVLIAYVLEFLKLAKLKTFFVLFIFTGLLYFLYQDITNSILASGNLTNINHWSQGFIMIHEQYGFILSLLTFAVLFVLLIVVTLAIPNEAHIAENLYVNVKFPLIKDLDLLDLYFLQIFRRVENYATVLMTYFIFVFLLLSGIMNPLNALFLNMTLGLYMYVQTDRIRILYFKLKYSALKDYFCLIFSQTLYLVIISIPMLVIKALFLGLSLPLSETLIFYLDIFLAIILTTLIGILFPSKEENPFSPFTGMMIMVIITVAMTLILQFLNLSSFYNHLILTAVYLFMVYVSWLGLVKLREEVIYAKNQVNL